MKNKPKALQSGYASFDSRVLASDHADKILAEQIKLLYRQAKSAFIATLCVATVLVAMLWDHVSHHWLVGWLIAQYLLTLIRYLCVLSYFQKRPIVSKSARWGRIFILGVFLSGVLWGIAGGIFFVAHSVVHQLSLALLLGGIAAGAMSTLSAYKNLFFIFIVPSILPYTYQVIMHESEVHVTIYLTYYLFFAILVYISKHLHHTLTDSLQLRFDNADLLSHLFEANDRQNEINQILQDKIVEKELAENALTKANEQLENRVMERTEALLLSNNVLQQEKELFRVTLASIGDAVITTDAAGNITFLNPVAELLTGWCHSEAKNEPLRNIFNIKDMLTQHPIDNPIESCLTLAGKYGGNQECRLIQKDKQECIVDYSVAPILDEKNHIVGKVLIFRDVTEQRKLTQKLAYQAAHDPLTGLLNREEFEVRLTNVLNTVRENDPHALLYLDLDQFKVVNDTCGHSAGDEMLRQVTALLHSKLRARDTLARLGGDEFGIILEHCPQKEAANVAQMLREMVQDFRFQWQDKTFTIGVSIGLFPISQSNVSLSKVLSAADSACYAAKESGRNRVHTYESNDSLLLKRSGEMQWLPRLQRAIAEDRLCLYFQPIMPISKKISNEKHGEVLLRLHDEQGKLVLPGAFLPSAERYDQMTIIDRWVVKHALELFKIFPDEQTKNTYAINLSAQSLGDENFLDFIVDHVKAYKKSPANLCFEINENAALADLKSVVRFIETLKGLGCHFSMDDFGSGLSSFGYLKDIHIDYLKIDGRLVKDMSTDPIDRAMVEAIHNIGNVMELKTIAEWVEDANTVQLLEEMGVDYVQGFWLAKPFLIDRMKGV